MQNFVLMVAGLIDCSARRKPCGKSVFIVPVNPPDPCTMYAAFSSQSEPVMARRKDTLRHTHATRLIPVFLVLTLVSASGEASAGWLDKIKELLPGGENKHQSLSSDDISGGLKEALRVGTQEVVKNLGAIDGFNLDPQIHIPLPRELDQVKKALGKIGMDSMLTDLETRLNRAAEIATPKAKQLFITAINEMTLDDVMAIYKGPEDSATQYFKSRMSGSLAVTMKPIVDESLADVGAAKSYDKLMARYNSVPFVPKVEANLGDYVVEKGMDGIFFYLAREEAAIRQNPAARTTELLRTVFGK